MTVLATTTMYRRTWRQMLAILILASSVASAPATDEQELQLAAEAGFNVPKEAIRQWMNVKQDISKDKDALCSFLLVQKSDAPLKLTLEFVSGLLEQSLDHMGKATDYTVKIKPFLKPDMLQRFDIDGSRLVLEISRSRSALIARYNKATSDERRKEVLEHYFYKACASKMGTMISESTMLNTMLKLDSRRASRSGNAPEIEATH